MRILGVERIKTASRGMKCPFLSFDRNEAIVNRFQNLIDNSSSSIDCIFKIKKFKILLSTIVIDFKRY